MVITLLTELLSHQVITGTTYGMGCIGVSITKLVYSMKIWLYMLNNE